MNQYNYEKWTTEDVLMTPFVKWVGGKRQVIDKYLKDKIPSFNRYVEPFAGGAAMFLHLKPKEAIINDLNEALINGFLAIQNEPYALMRKLDSFAKKHSEEFYNKMRTRKFRKTSSIAAQLIYLNKTCFNGMYRVNSNGFFNVPLNKDTLLKPKRMYDTNNITALNVYFNTAKVEFTSKDYLITLDNAKSGDFVFCDPPYDYDQSEKSFVEYTKSGFNQEDQKKLAQKLLELDKKGVKWLLTNHDTKLIRELYQSDDAHIKLEPMTTNRFINSDSTKRVATGKEIMVYNYEI
ncbi:DNA adenine methylase [Ureaplasma ceti]|uniref:Site-specific DNA-methyltransferase (adenine-specific) n=1 Tax=Ureaplasma ceti TaxID=3119530 RepID=A0ABP9UBS3_9BACT